MAFFDMPSDQLENYKPALTASFDFDEFWEQSYMFAHNTPMQAVFKLVKEPLDLVDVYDVSFPGYAGQPIKAWLLLPKGVNEPLPCVVEYVGYGGGRGKPHCAGAPGLSQDLRALPGDEGQLFRRSLPGSLCRVAAGGSRFPVHRLPDERSGVMVQRGKPGWRRERSHGPRRCILLVEGIARGVVSLGLSQPPQPPGGRPGGSDRRPRLPGAPGGTGP